MRGWEGGILRFLAARFAEKGGFWATVTEAVRVRCCGTASFATASANAGVSVGQLLAASMRGPALLEGS